MDHVKTGSVAISQPPACHQENTHLTELYSVVLQYVCMYLQVSHLYCPTTPTAYCLSKWRGWVPSLGEEYSSMIPWYSLQAPPRQLSKRDSSLQLIGSLESLTGHQFRRGNVVWQHCTPTWSYSS